jgi:2-polyprenyl-3-methyl-5-hydroxy-6-metoxy-1,4-benzoquinol methylase
MGHLAIGHCVVLQSNATNTPPMEASTLNIHRQCPLCNRRSLQPLPGYFERHGLVQCTQCSLVLMGKIPTAAELETHYRLYSYERPAQLSPLTQQRYHDWLDEFEPYRQSNRLLDVGCGRGWFLIEAQKRGWQVYGTEFSASAVALCQQQGIEMHHGPLGQVPYSAGFFDVITSIEVLEHTTTPMADMAQMHKLLRTGGLLYCTTPNFNALQRYYLKADYDIIEYPEHLFYFTKKTLNRMARAQGFRCKRFLSTGISISRLRRAQPLASNPDIPINNLIHTPNADEQLRQQIAGKWYLNLAKKLVNQFLTWTNLGLTLKGYYVKAK